MLEKEFQRRGEKLSRRMVAELLYIPEITARAVLFALENRDIIAFNPSVVPVGTSDIELNICDLHIPFQDHPSLNALFSFADELKPTIININGDLIDFYKISRFVKNPINKSVTQEIKEAKGFLSDIRKRFPEAKIYYKKGNHEDRLDKYIMSSADEIYELVEDLLETKLGLHEMNITYLSEPYQIGKLWHLHGHEKPGGTYNPEYITNVFWKYIHDHFMVGHFHRSQDKVFKRIDGKVYWGGAVGYLAKELDYATLNSWTRGFSVVRYNPDGSFKAELRQIFNGEVY